MDKRMMVALGMGALILLGLLVFVFFRQTRVGPEAVTEAMPVEMTGERHSGWTPFYHADEGTWKILDKAAYVLKEKKFTSSDAERDAYTVFTLKAGDRVRTVASQGRWKQVEVLVDDAVVAEGWMDAHFIQRVELVSVVVDAPPGTDDGRMEAPVHEDVDHH